MKPTVMLCLGGTFNPVHYGHLRCGLAAAEAIGAPRLSLVPTAWSPFRASERRHMPSAEQRLAMCRLAAAEFGNVDVLDLEVRRGGPSFTIDTVRALKAAGHPRVAWLIGADHVSSLPKWQEAESLVVEAELWVMGRSGWTYDFSQIPAPFRVLKDRVLPTPLVDISASQIRAQIAAGKAIDGLTPSAVAGYIRAERLYEAG